MWITTKAKNTTPYKLFKTVYHQIRLRSCTSLKCSEKTMDSYAPLFHHLFSSNTLSASDILRVESLDLPSGASLDIPSRSPVSLFPPQIVGKLCKCIPKIAIRNG